MQVQLGDAAPRDVMVVNTSPATVDRALNGVIARTVMQILSNPQVLAYLAATPAAATSSAAGPGETDASR